MSRAYDYLVVGAGMFGAAFARAMADAGKRCLVVEKRRRVAGNAYTEEREGIVVHMYGPHVFHCDDERIWRWVRRFATFNRYVHQPRAYFRGRTYSLPISLITLRELWGVTTAEEARARLESDRVRHDDPQTVEQWALAHFGRDVYEVFIRGYTEKQWMRPASEVPAAVLKRLPLRLSADRRYFADRFQGVPHGGYTRMVERMLDGIDVRLGVDFLAARGDLGGLASKVVWSGRIDEYYDLRFGELEYRALRFEHEVLRGDFQGVAQLNYTDAAVPWTRIVEHKHFDPARAAALDATVVTREYPERWSGERVPCYPINDAVNTRRFERYREIADADPSVVFGGRLGEYRYWDMHQVIGSALAKARAELASGVATRRAGRGGRRGRPGPVRGESELAEATEGGSSACVIPRVEAMDTDAGGRASEMVAAGAPSFGDRVGSADARRNT